MRKLALFAIAYLTMGAWFGNVEKQDVPDQNILTGLNPGAENGLAKWVPSTAAHLTAETAAPGFGTKSLSWDAAVSTDTLRTADAVVDLGLGQKACLAEIYYKYAAGATGDIVMRVETDAGDALTLDLDLSVSSEWVKGQLGFVCPTNDSVRIELEATTTAGAILIDNAYIGRDFRLGDTTPVTNWENFTPSFTNYPAHTVNTAIKRRVGGSMEVQLVVTATAGGSGGGVNFTVPDSLTLYASARAALGHGTYSGTNSDSLQVYSSSGANIDILVTDGGATTALNGSAIASGSVLYLNMLIPITEWSGSGTPQVTLDTQDSVWSAIIAGDHINLSTTSVASYTQVGDADLSITAAAKSKSIGIACSAPATEVQEVGDTTCTGSEGTEVAGVVIDADETGWYTFCSRYTQFFVLNAAETIEDIWRISETANNSTTALQSGSRISVRRTEVGNGDLATPVNLCADFYFSSVGTKRIVLEYVSAISGTIGATDHRILMNGSGNNMNMGWSVYKMSGNKPHAVALVGPTSQVQVDAPNGHGSTNTVIRRYTNIRKNEGLCITYADSATLGASFTINCGGMYCASMTDSRSTAATGEIAATVNTAEPTTAVSGLADQGEKMFFANNGAVSNIRFSASGCRLLQSGDVIRPHTNSGNDCTSTSCMFSLVQVSH